MRYRLIKLEEIELDKENPRIISYLEKYKDINEFGIGLALGSTGSSITGGNSYEVLKESIKTNKGIINPIIVRTIDDGYIVIEGNTRVFIYREFKEEGIIGDWDFIPAIVYDEISEKDINAIRLQAHLVGPREWDAYSKAKYITKLYINNDMNINDIIDFCGGKKREINEYIHAYQMMESSYRKELDSEDDFEKNKFSAFVEYQKGSIRKVLREKGYTDDDFSRWVIHEKFRPLNTIRSLPAIVNDEKALKEFLKKNGTAKEAVKHIDIPISSKIDIDNLSIKELVNALVVKFRGIDWEYNRRVINNPDGEENILINNLIDQLNSFLNFEENDE